jgi:DNA repair exonuclease SbcCD ATPase subunit
MRIAHVTIKNIMGLRELEFQPGSFTEITGQNGTSKTSVLEAIKSVFKGGHDATLLRDGAEQGEVVLVLDDGTEITKTVRPHTSDVKIKRDGRILPRPTDLIKELVDRLSNNPIAFLTAKKEDRVSVFLQSVPLTVDIERLSFISGVKVPPLAEGVHAYQILDHVYQQVFDDRHDTNLAIDEKKKTIKQLREAMPEAPPGVIGGETELEAQLTALDAKKDTDLGEVHNKLSTFTNGVNAQIAKLTTDHDVIIQKSTDGFDEQIAALQKKIDELRNEKAEKLATMRGEKNRAIKEQQGRIISVTGKANDKRVLLRQEHQEARAPIETQLALLRANRNLAAKREQTQETLETLEAEVEALQQDVARQEKALIDIKAYRSEVLANLPIPGLEVREGEIYRNNVVFDRLNHAQRIDIAVAIAELRAGDLGVVCVDGIEALDNDSFAAFKERTAPLPLQFFVSRVANTPFNISTDAPSF